MGCTVTYSHIVFGMQPHKEDPIRVRLNLALNWIEYPGKVTIKTSDLITFKIHTNSVIFTRGARYAGFYIRKYYLEAPIGHSEYTRLHIRLITPDINVHFNLNVLVYQDGWIYMEIIRGVYGITQVGILANNLIQQHLIDHGYFRFKLSPGFWQHVWRPF